MQSSSPKQTAHLFVVPMDVSHLLEFVTDHDDSLSPKCWCIFVCLFLKSFFSSNVALGQMLTSSSSILFIFLFFCLQPMVVMMLLLGCVIPGNPMPLCRQLIPPTIPQALPSPLYLVSLVQMLSWNAHHFIQMLNPHLCA